MSIAAHEAAVRKLEATARRQAEALEATKAQIQMFRELIDAANAKLSETVAKGGLRKV